MKNLFIIVIVVMVGVTAVFVGMNKAVLKASPDNSSAPVVCSNADAVKPIIVASNDSPCPGGVYCNNPNTNCGEFCCEWGYFYSNPCTCRCYRSSYDAGADCSTYFRCQ